MTRLFLIGAALFASACSFHTHETVIVQPEAPRPVYAAAPRERVAPNERRPTRARPEKPRAGDDRARPDPRPRGDVAERRKRQPRPSVDRKKPPRRVVVCTREAKQHRKECKAKNRKG